MKVLHTGDWHIGQFKGPIENGENVRSQDTIKCLEFMLERAKLEKPDLVCISGDIFHQEQIGPVRYSDEMVAATTIIEELSKVSRFVVVMRGTPNHDGEGQFRVLTKMLSHNKKVFIVVTPQIISTPIADIACIPGFDKQEFRSKFSGLSAEDENLVWTKNISDMVLGLRAQCSNNGNPAILMAHYTVTGCNMESGQTSFFTNFEPVIPRESLQMARFDGVFLGHIHRPQKIVGLNNVFYSGAINAMNFNDEGQERGFWIHEFASNKITSSDFIETPYRQFKTIEWEKEDVEDYLQSGGEFLFEQSLGPVIQNKIVRLRYSCTGDQKKALNIPVLQRDLYDLGAFYVADIEAEQMIDITNRQLLSEESDPLLNLKKWLDEKCYKDTEEIIELAEPIIAMALKQSNTAEICGIFRPVSLSVRNYRNYKEEKFDFTDVSFCTINGQNGAGKSSFFMDAIVDCLFEETREGDNKAWIRGTEDARSGSIEFIFEIGKDRFRVVRTRTKSGKPTLNISQLDGVEWLNLSKERIIDTQAEIIRILGMDAMTFKSCALIMQDQYGLFLQARKDERINILSNLLGLGVYNIMELESKKRLSDSKKKLSEKKEAVRIKKEFIISKGSPDEELQKTENSIIKLQIELDDLEKEKKEKQQLLESSNKAKERRNDVLQKVTVLSNKKGDLEQNKDYEEQLVNTYNVFLNNREEIINNANEYREWVEKGTKLATNKAQFEIVKEQLDSKLEEIKRYENNIGALLMKNEQIKEELKEFKQDNSFEIQAGIEKLMLIRSQLEEVRQRKDKHILIVNEANKRKEIVIEEVNELNTQLKLKLSELDICEKQKEFIMNSRCIDIERADCVFLKQAKDDAEKIAELKREVETLQNIINIKKNEYTEFALIKNKELVGNGYKQEAEKELINQLKVYEPYEQMKVMADELKVKNAKLEAEMESNDKIIKEAEACIDSAQKNVAELTENVNKLIISVNEYYIFEKEIERLKPYIEQEKQIPLYEERLKISNDKLETLRKELENVNSEYIVLSDELMRIDEELKLYSPKLKHEIDDINSKIKVYNSSITNLQIQKGALQQQIDDVELMENEVKELEKAISKLALKAEQYEILKIAFSQDGVPHQIIRNIIPLITDTANSILGSMTGGTMGVEFVMEKTVKGKDGDKATLDVLINEYGKTTLPYASKSGGEKVKASLAVILALAEVKTSAVGIRLGMLFIDEPPFLDEDGVQAYVDSLDAIKTRYHDVKIMAITHDYAMKARFEQSISVVKTDEGSKIIY